MGSAHTEGITERVASRTEKRGRRSGAAKTSAPAKRATNYR